MKKMTKEVRERMYFLIESMADIDVQLSNGVEDEELEKTMLKYDEEYLDLLMTYEDDEL
ncbi:MAG: hypothetical protein ACRCXT_08645 [Paraclostridium sp.]